MPKSQNPTTSFGRTESLGQMNDRKSVILTTILDALTHGLSRHGPAPIAIVTAFRLPTERLSHVRTPSKRRKFLILGRDFL